MNDNDMGKKIRAYCLYVVLLVAVLAPPMVFLDNGFGEMLSRSWLLSAVLFMAPAMVVFRRLYIQVPVGGLVFVGILYGQAYIAYGYHNYNPHGAMSTSTGWLVLAIIYSIGMAEVSQYVTRRVAWDGFSIFGAVGNRHN